MNLRLPADFFLCSLEKHIATLKCFWEDGVNRALTLKTLAAKHKTSVQKVSQWLNQGSYRAFRHNGKEYKIFSTKDIKKPKFNYEMDSLPDWRIYNARTELDTRMKANVCEYCGRTKGYFEVHHIKKMKDIKDGKADWQKHMIARNRKTLILCISCHNLLHAGKLPDKRHFSR